jgi:2',3'-cyclic-nucleotide 2'-phosphodiesterase
MKIFFVGDIVGRPGRDAIAKFLPSVRETHKPDIVIANADNASHLRGATPSTIKELYDLGIDLLTGGDHVWDQKETVAHLDRSPWILRPLNYPEGTPGKGWHIVETKNGKKLLVLHALGRLTIPKLTDNPFGAMDHVLKKYTLGENIDAIFVDFHAEATSEKAAMGYYLDGRVSAVVGTHTHIPTNDARILPKGTAFQTDAGMAGDYNSSLGIEITGPLHFFRTGLKLEHYKPAEGEGSLCGALVETDDTTGLAVSIQPIRMGGVLQ